MIRVIYDPVYVPWKELRGCLFRKDTEMNEYLYVVVSKIPDRAYGGIEYHIAAENSSTNLCLATAPPNIKVLKRFLRYTSALRLVDELSFQDEKNLTEKVRARFPRKVTSKDNARLLAYLGNDLVVSPGIYSVSLYDYSLLVQHFNQTRLGSPEFIEEIDYPPLECLIVPDEVYELVKSLNLLDSEVMSYSSSKKAYIKNIFGPGLAVVALCLFLCAIYGLGL